MKKVAIQGIRGSFHDIAAHQYFKGEELDIVCCDSFEDVFSTVSQDSSCLAFVAIENTIAGSLLHNYELLRQSVLSFYSINLTKIQSLPIIGKEWEYMFYIDVVYDTLSRFRQSIDAITPLTSELNILGEYVEAKKTNR